MSPSQVENLLKNKENVNPGNFELLKEILANAAVGQIQLSVNKKKHVSLLIILIMIIFIIFIMIMISGEQAEHAGVGSLARGRLSRPHRHCQQLARVQRQVKMIGLCKFYLCSFYHPSVSFLVVIQVRLNCV